MSKDCWPTIQVSGSLSQRVYSVLVAREKLRLSLVVCDTFIELMSPRSHHTGLTVIAVFKMLKGLLLLLLGLGLLKLVHAEIATLFSLLLETLHLNADSRLIHSLVLKVDALRPHSVLLAGVVSLGYGGMLLAEGIGLWLEFS